MGPKKQQGAAIGSQAIRNIQNAIDTDSDSYGSQGGLKEKPVYVPKRGGKKRNKNNQNGTSIGSGETIDGCQVTTKAPNIDWDKIDTESEESMSVAASQRSKKSKMSRKQQKQVPKNLQQEEEKAEDIQQDTPTRAKGIMLNGQVALPTVQHKPDNRDLSPPMIKEYDPNEENAKTRAAKRREELKKRENVIEIDRTQYKDDPTPWKGRPADFFLLHTPRRGTHKILNNSQKEFILIYYPDSVADPISLMDFLYRQAKNHEERQEELENERYQLNQNAIIRGSKNKKKNRQMKEAKYVQEMKHVNEEQTGRNRTTSARPMNFEQLLTEGSRAHAQNNNLLFGLRNQINLINERATHKMQEADMMSVQHSQAAGSTFGYCSHCHHHMTTTDSNFDQIEIKRERQAILQQICEAKKRQARMEAEEARRLQDEAQRLAQMANILELESQRPLLEARRLEEEAIQMETQYGRLTRTFVGLDQQKKTGLDKIYANQSQQRAQQQTSSLMGRQNVYQSMYEEQKTNMMLKKQQLLLDQRRTQMQIQSLQHDTSMLNTRAAERPRSRGGFIDSIPQHLQAAFDNHGRQPNHQNNSDDLMTGQTPAARMAIAEANAKAMAEKSKRERLERELIMKEKEKEKLKKQKEEESKAIAKAIEEALAQKKAREAKEREHKKQKFIREDETSLGYGDEESSDNDSEDDKQSRLSKFSKASSKIPVIKKREKKQEPEEDKWEKSSHMTQQHSVSIQKSLFNESVQNDVNSFDSDESKMSVRYTKPKKDKKKEELEKKKLRAKKKAEIETEEDRLLAEKVRNAMKKPEKVDLDTEDKDPYLAAADKEFEAAKKAFEQAQKLQQNAHKVKDKMLNEENEQILRAQREAEQFFLEKKRKLAEEEKRFKGEFKRDTPNNYQNNEETEYILKSFNNYMERIRREKWKLKERYVARKACKEFLQPILSGKILQDFDESKGYINFRQFELKDNFENGHQEYFAKWRQLFLYETYSFLMNSRWSKMTGSELELKNQIQKQASDKALCWKGYFQTKGNDNGFTTIKMYREPPNVLAMTQKGKNFSRIYDEPERREGERFELTHCREEDLIVISKFRINLDGQEDIKMAPGGMKFLKEVLNKPGVIFGLVNKCSSKTDDFVEVLIDARFMGAFSNASDGQSTFTRYCYFFESVLTCMREFRAMKSLEFTRLAPSICYPTLALEHRDKIVDEYSEVVNSGFEDYDNGPNMFPKSYDGDDEKGAHQMNNYLLHNHELYNKSQARVLEQVIEMPKDDVALIQGPPGTGKTHTIIGIISMIMSTRMANTKQKILVCAPSNAAIDQILSRIVTKGLVGLKGLKRQKEPKKNKKKRELDVDSDSEEFCEVPDLTHSLLRITSAEYQTESPAIKKHTLEQRIIKKLCIEKFGELRKCIKDLRDMLKELDDFDAWDEYPEFPYVNGIKFKGYTKVLKDASLNSVHDWGNVNMTRTQQKVAMQQQLKIHERELNEFKTGNNVHQGNQEWKEAEKAIIAEAKIICCTLSMAGSAKMQEFTNQFEYLIVDEACQSTEPCTLIPFALAPRRVILVGDQKQLPATTFSSNSEETGYCRSLFERLLDSGYQKTMLTIQFRMHPKIRAFPSEQFYGGAITDHQSIGFRSAPLTISNLARVFSSRMIFFDIHLSEEVYDNKSKCNMEEADFTKVLIDFMARKMSLQGTLKYVAGQIGVISPYKAQVRQLYSRLERLCSDQGCNIQDTLEVNTVDAFQGSEKDVIIFNCVRSNSEHTIEKSLGFLLDERRLNVAITRPKFFLLVVGNSQTLRKSYVWDDMIEYAQNQGKYIHITDRSKFETMNDFKKHVVPQFLFD